MDSIDAIVKFGGLFRPQIDFQLKSTSSPCLRRGNLHFQLPQKNYNDLAAPRHVPIILAVLELPENPGEWLNYDSNELVLRRRLWWISLEGEPQISAESKTVIIPESQLLTPDSLSDLAENIRERILESMRP